MTILPIVGRELRVMARQRRFFWARCLAAAMALALWLLLSLVNSRAPVPQRASASFLAIGVATLAFAMLSGMFLTADCLSEERREGTLGLLFLTALKGHDVVLGKLVSTSLLSVFGLLAVLPILALPLLMGGMTGGEFWRTTLVLLVAIFFSLSLAMLVSALTQDARAAVLGSLLVMVVLAGLLPVLWWMQWLTIRLSTAEFLLWASPAFAFRRGLDAYYSVHPGVAHFWVSIGTQLGLSLMSLLAASVVLPRLESESAAPRASSVAGRSTLRFGSAGWRRARRWLIEARPCYWLATRDRLLKVWSLAVVGGLLAFWLVGFAGLWSSSRTWARGCFGVAILMGYAMHVIFKCLVAAEASRCLSDGRNSGALELLLSTPLQPEQIVQSHGHAVWDGLRWPRWLLVGMNLALVWMFLGPNPLGMPGDAQATFTIMLLGGILLLYSDTYAMTQVGPWLALTTKRHTQAVLGILRRVMLLPLVAVLLFVLTSMSTGVQPSSMNICVVLWFAGGLALDLIVAVNARWSLVTHFRAAAAGLPIRWTSPSTPDLVGNVQAS